MALVTGASAGIGRGLARECLEHGFDVIITGASDHVHKTGAQLASSAAFAQSLRQELLGTDVTVTALLPGATATEFHQRAGIGNTSFGDNSWKNDPVLVARKGFDALMAGRDHVIGGDGATWRAAVVNKVLPERVKAARQAKLARPR